MKCKNVTASGLHWPARYSFPVPILRGIVNAPSVGSMFLLPVALRGCGRDKSSDPISAFLKQEVHFQNIEHMANGCQQPGFHSFYHRKI